MLERLQMCFTASHIQIRDELMGLESGCVGGCTNSPASLPGSEAKSWVLGLLPLNMGIFDQRLITFKRSLLRTTHMYEYFNLCGFTTQHFAPWVAALIRGRRCFGPACV